MSNPHLTGNITVINGNQAYAHLHAYMIQHKTGFRGLCHKTCQDAWGLPARYAGAIQAWEAIPNQYKHQNINAAPVGAPVFYSGGQWGHVALMTKKAGIVISTDAPTSGFIGEVPYDWFKTHWDKKYLGWSSYYNGKELNFLSMPQD